MYHIYLWVVLDFYCYYVSRLTPTSVSKPRKCNASLYFLNIQSASYCHAVHFWWWTRTRSGSSLFFVVYTAQLCWHDFTEILSTLLWYFFLSVCLYKHENWAITEAVAYSHVAYHVRFSRIGEKEVWSSFIFKRIRISHQGFQISSQNSQNNLSPNYIQVSVTIASMLLDIKVVLSLLSQRFG